MVISRK